MLSLTTMASNGMPRSTNVSCSTESRVASALTLIVFPFATMIFACEDVEASLPLRGWVEAFRILWLQCKESNDGRRFRIIRLYIEGVLARRGPRVGKHAAIIAVPRCTLLNILTLVDETTVERLASVCLSWQDFRRQTVIARTLVHVVNAYGVRDNDTINISYEPR